MKGNDFLKREVSGQKIEGFLRTSRLKDRSCL